MIAFLATHLDVVLFGAAIVLMMFGFPVAFTLAGVALGFAWIGAELGVFRWATLNFLPQRVWA
ncbi:MAG: tripartite transporter, partial [Paracoccaceae bacterium]|nr:tripartite transporter [Paracoccaceae bacterium]